MTAPRRCPACRSILSAWEPPERCACRGARRHSHAEIMYAIACAAPGPLHVRDYVRLADADHRYRVDQATANTTLANDPRLCWAGSGIYGLYRHGPLPGPRNLEHVARLVLLAVETELTVDALDYCLKQLGYRYNVASLNNAILRSRSIRWTGAGYSHPHGEAAQLSLRRDIPIVPPQRRAEFDTLCARLRQAVRRALKARAERIRRVADPTRYASAWE
jgi:hypothetical protein